MSAVLAALVAAAAALQASTGQVSRLSGSLQASTGRVGRLSGSLAYAASATDAAFAEGLQANLDEHAAEMSHSVALGFERAKAAVATVDRRVYRIDRRALGMGSRCPFDTDELVVASTAPVFTASECRAVREEAAALISGGSSSSTFTMTDTNRDVALHDLPQTKRWLNDGAFARLASLAAECFPSAVDGACSLWVYRGLVINYEASAGLTHQPIHRDGSLISCVVPLSERAEYEGGGTFIEPLDGGVPLALEQGCALLHPSAVRHAGHRITAGERWVLVLFLNAHVMHNGEHGRRFRARARQHLAEAQAEAQLDEGVGEALAAEAAEAEGVERVERVEELVEEEVEAAEGGDDDEDGELQCLLHALRASDESDHEVWYDLGSRAHEMGEAAEALRMYERGHRLNARDPLLLGNMGAALLELGRRREAFRCYRRALEADAHDVNARYNGGELLLEEGRLHGLAALLEAAPAEAMRDGGLQQLAEELRAARRLL